MLTIRYSICFRTTNYNAGYSLCKKHNKLLRRTEKAFSAISGFSLIILRKILLIANATAGDELFNLGYSALSIWIISSSFLGS